MFNSHHNPLSKMFYSWCNTLTVSARFFTLVLTLSTGCFTLMFNWNLDCENPHNARPGSQALSGMLPGARGSRVQRHQRTASKGGAWEPPLPVAIATPRKKNSQQWWSYWEPSLPLAMCCYSDCARHFFKPVCDIYLPAGLVNMKIKIPLHLPLPLFPCPFVKLKDRFPFHAWHCFCSFSQAEIVMTLQTSLLRFGFSFLMIASFFFFFRNSEK